MLSAPALRPWVYTGGDGRIEGFWGLATKPTHHRFTVGGRTLWTWCAQDSLFLPELLGETARIESSDPETGDPTRLTVSPETVEKAEPEDILIEITVHNRGPETARLRVLPQAWFRNTWSFEPELPRPVLQGVAPDTVRLEHPELSTFQLYFEGDAELLFTENESNARRLWNSPNASASGE